jgi:hypothetical protein
MVKYPQIEIQSEGQVIKIPFSKPRKKYSSFIQYTITQEDTEKSKGHVFSVLAENFYGTANLWEHIAMANPPIVEAALKPGFKLKIPRLVNRNLR